MTWLTVWPLLSCVSLSLSGCQRLLGISRGLLLLGLLVLSPHGGPPEVDLLDW